MRGRLAKLFRYAMPVLFFAGVVVADDTAAPDIETLIAQGENAYAEGQYLSAATYLENAAQLIREQMGGAFVDLLPEPLDGWTAAEPSTTSGALAVTQTTRMYTHTDSGGRIKIEITASSALSQGIAAMMQNPVIIASQNGQIQEIGGQQVTVVANQATAIIGEVVVQINAIGSATQAHAVEYANALDFDDIVAFAGTQADAE